MTHGDDEGTLGEVGDGPEPANLTKMAGGSEVEDDGDSGDAGLPASRELVETKRKARRFLWKHRRGEGWTLAAVELVGALGCSWSIARERAEGDRDGGRDTGE